MQPPLEVEVEVEVVEVVEVLVPLDEPDVVVVVLPLYVEPISPKRMLPDRDNQNKIKSRSRVLNLL